MSCHGKHGPHRPHEEMGHSCFLGGFLRGFLQPCLLFLLAQGPSHGYELMERLAQDPTMPQADPGLLYRTLRQMEAEGLVTSAWDTEGQGPARRRYTLTDEGFEILRAWAARLAAMRADLDAFVSKIERTLGAPHE
mgnify:CR=1 FL=1